MELKAFYHIQDLDDKTWSNTPITIVGFVGDGHYFNKPPTEQIWAIFYFDESPTRELEYDQLARISISKE